VGAASFVTASTGPLEEGGKATEGGGCAGGDLLLREEKTCIKNQDKERRRYCADYMPTRKQHYVNQFYLKPRTENGQLASMIRGKILPNTLANIANQRDFYEVAELSPEDIRRDDCVLAALRRTPWSITRSWANRFAATGIGSLQSY
jgi:hypothetical protein